MQWWRSMAYEDNCRLERKTHTFSSFPSFPLALCVRSYSFRERIVVVLCVNSGLQKMKYIIDNINTRLTPSAIALAFPAIIASLVCFACFACRASFSLCCSGFCNVVLMKHNDKQQAIWSTQRLTVALRASLFCFAASACSMRFREASDAFCVKGPST